jgi:fructokinase
MCIRVAGLGEVLWDLLPSGPQLGGAPANFAGHARALGAQAAVISRVGNDDLGREIVRRLSEAGVATDAIGVDPDLPTGTVSVRLTADGQPQFTISSNVAWDRIEAGEAAFRAVGACDVVCFGTLAQRDERSRQGMGEILDSTPRNAVRLLDINLRAPFVQSEIVKQSLVRANVLKLNEQELPIVADMLGLAAGSVSDRLRQLIDRFSLRLVALTRGAGGSLLRSASGQVSEHAGTNVEVVDAVGAGDAFTAAMILGYLRGWDLGRIGRQANEVAAFVCTQPGATPSLPPSLVEQFRSGSKSPAGKAPTSLSGIKPEVNPQG